MTTLNRLDPRADLSDPRVRAQLNETLDLLASRTLSGSIGPRGPIGATGPAGADGTDASAIFVTESITNGVGSPKILTAEHSGRRFNNDGASARVYVTLPASATVGTHYYFDITDTDGFRVTAAGGTTIRINSLVTAANGYVEGETVGTGLHLVLTAGGEWRNMVPTGIWYDGSFRTGERAIGSYTPTMGWTTNTTTTAWYQVRDGFCTIGIKCTFAGAPDAVGFTFSVPTNMDIDTTWSYAHHYGGILVDASPSGYYSPIVMGHTSGTAWAANYCNGTSTITTISRTAPITIASGDSIQLLVTYRLANWKP